MTWWCIYTGCSGCKSPRTSEFVEYNEARSAKASWHARTRVNSKCARRQPAIASYTFFIFANKVKAEEVSLWPMLLLFYNYYYGISPFCMCSIIICFCISPKLSNSLPHDLHLKYLERSSSLCLRLSFVLNYHRSYCIYLVCIAEKGFVLLSELYKTHNNKDE